MKAIPKDGIKGLIGLFVLLFLGLLSKGQSPTIITFNTLMDSTLKNDPITQKAALFQEQWDVQLDQIRKRNLPQVEFNAKATYQSEVIGLNLNIPGMDVPSLSNDQYKFSLDIQQSIYKGNISAKQRELSSSQRETYLKQMEVELYQVKRSLVEQFYGLMFNTEQLKMIQSYESQLDIKIKEFEALVSNGSLLQIVLDGLLLEKMKLKQQYIGLSNDRLILVNNLSLISGLSLDTSMIFVQEDFEIAINVAHQRPEFQLMEQQQQQLAASRNMINSKYLPMVYAFGTAGYGRPGLNYLADKFDDFYMLGLGVNWKLWTWHEGNRERQLLEIQNRLIDVQKESFEQNQQKAVQMYQTEIKKQMELIKTDNEMIMLQTQIVEATEKQLKNGVINSSSYIAELEKLQQYGLNMEMHKLKRMLAKVNYLWAIGLL